MGGSSVPSTATPLCRSTTPQHNNGRFSNVGMLTSRGQNNALPWFAGRGNDDRTVSPVARLLRAMHSQRFYHHLPLRAFGFRIPPSLPPHRLTPLTTRRGTAYLLFLRPCPYYFLLALVIWDLDAISASATDATLPFALLSTPPLRCLPVRQDGHACFRLPCFHLTLPTTPPDGHRAAAPPLPAWHGDRRAACRSTPCPHQPLFPWATFMRPYALPISFCTFIRQQATVRHTARTALVAHYGVSPA